MKNLKYSACLFILLLTTLQCTEDAPGIYENCCGTPPTADTVDQNLPGSNFPDEAYVYIPNIFIVSNTGVLDPDYSFVIFGSESVKEILSVRYIDKSGAVLFSQFNIKPNDVGYSWNGALPNGAYFTGPFDYDVEVEFVDGQRKTYSGSACAVGCGDPAFPKPVLPDCYFPSQNNGQGSPDPSLPVNPRCF